MALTAAGASAQTAILECSAARADGRRITLTFRTGVADGIHVTKATLVLHLRAPLTTDARLRVNGAAAVPTLLDEGWISVPVPSRQALKAITIEGVRFDGPATPNAAPYLAVEGPAAFRSK